MIAAVIAILSVTVLGVPFVLAVDRGAPALRVLGLAFLYGTGVVYFVLFGLSVVHVRWSLVSVTIAALAVWVAMAVTRLRGYEVPPAQPHLETSKPRNLVTPIADLVTLATITGFAVFATIAPLWEWDFWAIWGLKGRVFLEHGGVDWRFLESGWNTFAHPDYPLLVPLNFDVVALVSGGWNDHWLGLLFVAWAVALLLVARELAARETTPLVAALITLALSTLAVSRYVGLAEGTLIAFAGAGILFVRRAMLFDDDVAWRHGAILLGLAACTKNEGLALIASVVVAIVVSDVRRAGRALRLWPALALAAPWLIARGVHHLPTDLVSGSIAGRFAARLGQAGDIITLLDLHLYERWFWVALVAGIVVVPAAARARERFVLLATAIQLAVYVVTYFVTPYNPRWHIVTSWPRLTGQVAVPATYAVMVMLANSLRPAEDSTNAQARSEQQ